MQFLDHSLECTCDCSCTKNICLMQDAFMVGLEVTLGLQAHISGVDALHFDQVNV